ncbi:MAG: hypothetical protein JW838_06635 [Spirochaetes bacterium]|nr:hypothetical protein [Spirochaetota bacterium]
MDKKECFQEFRDGKRNLFFLVTRDCTDEILQQHMFYRRIDDRTISTIGFISEEDAGNFLGAVIKDRDNWKIIHIDVLAFDAFLDSLDGDFRGNLLFEMM